MFGFFSRIRLISIDYDTQQRRASETSGHWREHFDRLDGHGSSHIDQLASAARSFWRMDRHDDRDHDHAVFYGSILFVAGFIDRYYPEPLATT